MADNISKKSRLNSLLGGITSAGKRVTQLMTSAGTTTTGDDYGQAQVIVTAMPATAVEVNLDSTNDEVAVYGSDDGGATRRIIKTDSGGTIQTDIESYPSASASVQVTGFPSSSATVTVNNSVTIGAFPSSSASVQITSFPATSATVTVNNSPTITFPSASGSVKITDWPAASATAIVNNSVTITYPSASASVQITAWPSASATVTVNNSVTVAYPTTSASVSKVPQASSAYACSVTYSNGAYEASRVAKASAGNLLGFSGYNSNTNGQFVQIWDSASLPANGAIPVISVTVAGLSSFAYDTGQYPIPLSTGIVVGNSSSATIKVLGSADCLWTVMFI